VDPLELRKPSLGSENEFDGATRCTSVESSGESKIGLHNSENKATLDRHNIGVDELITVFADSRGWSSRLEFAQICTEAMRALGD
jgi:hypothetical protein